MSWPEAATISSAILVFGGLGFKFIGQLKSGKDNKILTRIELLENHRQYMKDSINEIKLSIKEIFELLRERS